MKDKFLNSSINFINKYGNYSDKDIKKLRYGLEGLYLTWTKVIFITFISIVLGIIKEVLIILLLFNFLRFFGFGFHAEKSSHCLILSTLIFVIIPYIFLQLTITTKIFFLVSIFCLINILFFAPADTKKRPLRNRKKRIIRKILNLIVATSYITVGLVLNNNYINTLILVSLLIEVFVIIPTTYKVFKQPYNNYKNS